MADGSALKKVAESRLPCQPRLTTGCPKASSTLRSIQ